MSYVMAGLAIASFAADMWSASKADKAESKARKKTEASLAELFATTKKQLAFQRDIELRQIRRTGKAIKGKQRAGYAAAGIKVDTGTPLEVAIDTNVQLAIDKHIIKTRYDLEVDAAGKRAKAGMPQQLPSTLGPTALKSGLTLLTSAQETKYWGLMSESTTK